MLTAELDTWSQWFFIGAPVALLCLQYGWDMLLDDIVPLSRRTIERLATQPWED